MNDQQPADDESVTWDWVTVVVIALAIVLLLMLTFELWISHPLDSQ